MPIYAYRCANCGHAKDVLQRIADPVLTVCPVCGQESFRKQLTAAGFQLKGSGWYVTDFRGDKPSGKSADADESGTAADKGADKSADKAAPGAAEQGKSSAAEPSGAAVPSPAAPTPAPVPKPPAASAPATGTGTGSKPG